MKTVSKKKVSKLIAISAIVVLTITGCGSKITIDSTLKNEMDEAMNNNQNIKLSVEGDSFEGTRNAFTWVELDQNQSNKEIRKTWDDELGITKFDIGSKNGVLFVDKDGNWAGNNTLYNAFMNKKFVEDYWGDSGVKQRVAQKALEFYTDLQGDDQGLLASVNAYFNLVPTNYDGTSGLMNYTTRAEAMAAICKADTPLMMAEENTEFTTAVGSNPYNSCAQNLTANSYLPYSNGSLNKDTYNSTISHGEFIYMLVNRYFADELETVDLSTNPFTAVKNAGNVAEKLGFITTDTEPKSEKHAWQSYELEYCLQNVDIGCPENIYKSLVVAFNNGIIPSDFEWNKGVRAGTVVKDILNTYTALGNKNGYTINAKQGANVGKSLYIVIEEQQEKVKKTIGASNIEEVRDVTNIDELLKTYGDELNLTDEELQEQYEIQDKYKFEPVDTWMEVNYCSYLNIRKGPSTDFNIKDSVEKGTKTHIVAMCSDTGWYRIIVDGKIAYQCGSYFSDFEGSEEYLKKK